jgi:hypothetical protein
MLFSGRSHPSRTTRTSTIRTEGTVTDPQLGTSLLTDGVFDPPIPIRTDDGWGGWTTYTIRMTDGGSPRTHHMMGVPSKLNVIRTAATLERARPTLLLSWTETAARRKWNWPRSVAQAELLKNLFIMNRESESFIMNRESES